MDNTPTKPVDNASTAPTDSVMVPPATSTTTEGARGCVHDSEAAGAAPDPNAVAEVAAAPEANPSGGVDDTDSSEASAPPALSELEAAKQDWTERRAEISQMKMEIMEKEKRLAAARKVVDDLQNAASKERNHILWEETIARIVRQTSDHRRIVYSCTEERLNEINSNGKRMRRGIEANSGILERIHNNVGQILSIMQARNENNGSHPVAACSAVQENAVEGETVLSKPDHGASGPAKSFEGHIGVTRLGSMELRPQGDGHRLTVGDLVDLTIDSSWKVEIGNDPDGGSDHCICFLFSNDKKPCDSLIFHCTEVVAEDLECVLETIGVDIKP
jgi:hypothetical protein